MLTVKQASTTLGISDTTLRVRGKDYATWLSAHANPGTGNERKYTEEDIVTLRTVGILKSQNKTEAEITEALERGDILEPADMPQGAPKSSKTEETSLTVGAAFSEALKASEATTNRLQQKNDKLHERIEELTERAVRAETKLEAVAILNDAETPTGWRQRLAQWIAPKTE